MHHFLLIYEINSIKYSNVYDYSDWFQDYGFFLEAQFKNVIDVARIIF